jgi:O-antigen ligase
LASALVMVLLPFSALLVGNLVKDEKTLRWMVGLILLIVGVDLVIRFTGQNFPIDANGITHMWAITFAVSMAAFLKGLNRLQRGLLLALVIASVVWGFVLHLSWYSGWVPGFICIGVIAVIKSKKLFIALVLGLVLVVFLNRGYFLDNLAFKQTNDAVTRWAAWQINWQVTSQHLLFGTGPGGYAAYYMTYFPSTGMATHNNYIDIIAETGITGLMLYFWLFISLLILGYRIIRRVRGRGDFIESMSIGVFSGTIGCIVIMAFGDWMIPFAYTQTIAGYNYEVYSWLFLGTLIVLDRLTKNLKPPETALNLTV